MPTWIAPIALVGVASFAGFERTPTGPRSVPCECRESREPAALLDRAEFAGLARVAETSESEVALSVVEVFIAGTPDRMVVQVGDTSCDVFHIEGSWNEGSLVLVLGRREDVDRLHVCSGSGFLGRETLQALDYLRSLRVPGLVEGNYAIRFCEPDCESGRELGRGDLALRSTSQFVDIESAPKDELSAAWLGRLRPWPENGCYAVSWEGAAPGNLRAVRRSRLGWRSDGDEVVVEWSYLVDATVTLIGSFADGVGKGSVLDRGVESTPRREVAWEAGRTGSLDEQACDQGAA